MHKILHRQLIGVHPAPGARQLNRLLSLILSYTLHYKQLNAKGQTTEISFALK